MVYGVRGGATKLTRRFAVANVDDDDIRQVGDRLKQMNELMGMS